MTAISKSPSRVSDASGGVRGTSGVPLTCVPCGYALYRPFSRVQRGASGKSGVSPFHARSRTCVHVCASIHEIETPLTPLTHVRGAAGSYQSNEVFGSE